MVWWGGGGGEGGVYDGNVVWGGGGGEVLNVGGGLRSVCVG